MHRLTENRSGFYLLPNLFTTAGLFSGFYAVVAALKGHFEIAAISIFIAMILDSADGRIARLTNTTSAFGAEYDSLADMVSFGIAPALVVYSWSLTYLGKPGWVAAFIFTAAVALRLARFNTQTEYADKRFFQGLPCPAGAGVIASVVWLAYQLEVIMTLGLNILAAIITVIVGLLMISEVRYYSFKKINFRGKVPFMVLLVLLLVITVVVLQPPMLLFLAFSSYAFSGIAFTLARWFRRRQLSKKLSEQKPPNPL